MLARPALALLLAGCSCDVAGPPATSAPLRAEVAEIEVEEAASERAEPAPPSTDEARAWLTQLREARRLHHDGDHAAALAAFHALLEERPGSTRLRCEAGLIAHRAGELEEAERLTSVALRTWRLPVQEADRVAFAMCLYNRGLVARDRGEPDVAPDAWRRSLSLRPNRTVQAALAALDAADEADDGACDLASNLAALREQYGVEPTLSRTASGNVTLVRASFGPYPEDDDAGEGEGAECTSIEVLLEGPECTELLPLGVTECLWFSYFDEHASLGVPEFRDGGPTLGRIIVVTSSTGGRHDAPTGQHIEGSTESTLYLCAERRDWSCVEVSIESQSSVDCMGSGGCEDPDDPSDDGLNLPSDTMRGYSLRWSIAGDVLLLEAGEADTSAPPRVGRVPLVELFD